MDALSLWLALQVAKFHLQQKSVSVCSSESTVFWRKDACLEVMRLCSENIFEGCVPFSVSHLVCDKETGIGGKSKGVAQCYL